MTENTNKKTGTVSVVAIVILAIALIGLSIFAYNQYSENKTTSIELNSQRDSLTAEYEEMQEFYQAQLNSKDTISMELQQKLEKANSEIALYIDSLKNKKITISSLSKYKKNFFDLQAEKESLEKELADLKTKYADVSAERDQLNTALGEKIIFTDSVVSQNFKISERLKVGSMLNLTTLNVDAVKVRNNGKMISTPKAKRADRLKICFTVSPNAIATSEDKTFYVQVLAPGNKVLGSGQAVVEGKDPVLYSKMSTFFYENKALDVCEYVAKPGDEFFEGSYKVTVFDAELNELATSNFTLK